jgi:hypothetical protein
VVSGQMVSEHPKSAIDFFFVCHSSESWNPVHLNRGSGNSITKMTEYYAIMSWKKSVFKLQGYEIVVLCKNSGV